MGSWCRSMTCGPHQLLRAETILKCTCYRRSPTIGRHAFRPPSGVPASPDRRGRHVGVARSAIDRGGGGRGGRAGTRGAVRGLFRLAGPVPDVSRRRTWIRHRAVARRDGLCRGQVGSARRPQGDRMAAEDGGARSRQGAAPVGRCLPHGMWRRARRSRSGAMAWGRRGCGRCGLAARRRP